MEDKQYRRTFLWILVTGLLMGFIISSFIFGAWGSTHYRNNEVLSTKVEYLQGEVDLYSDLLDVAEEYSEKIKAENTMLKNKITELENDYNGDLHESYTECLRDIREDYDFDNYIVKQVGIIYANTDDIIYHFIIVIYDSGISEIRTFNCYALYDGIEFMYTDCDLVEG